MLSLTLLILLGFRFFINSNGCTAEDVYVWVASM